MSPFEFVAVFFSVVVGLGVSHLLAAASDLVEVRVRVKTDWVHSIWVGTVFLLLVHSWWGMWSLQAAPAWTYGAFLAVVGYLAAVYLLSTLVLPRVTDLGQIDLATHFAAVRPIFLTMLAAIAASAVLINYTLFDTPVVSTFTVIPALFAVAALVGTRLENRGFQASLALFVAAGMIVLMSTDETVLR